MCEAFQGASAGAVFANLPGIGKAASFLTGRTNESTVSINIANDILTSVVLDYVSKTTNNLTVTQTLVNKCNPSSYSTALSSTGCTAAAAAVNAIKQNALQLRTDASRISGSIYDTDCKDECAALSDKMKYACNDCVLGATDQVVTYNFSNSSEVLNEVMNQIKTQVGVKVEQIMKNYRDITGAVGDIVSTGSSSCMAADLQSRVNNSVNERQVQNLLNDMSAAQLVSIKGHSWYVGNLSQRLSVDFTSNMVAKRLSINKLYTDVEVQAAQSLITSNAALMDLARSIGDTVSGVVNILGETIGRVLIIAGCIAVFFMLVALLQPVVANRIASRVSAGRL